MIYISLSKRRSPGDTEGIEKVYAVAQRNEVWDLEKLAAHIAEHKSSKYGQGDIYAVLVELVNCVKEQLLNGNSVKLGNLGSFYIVLRSNGVDASVDATTYSTSNITAVRVGWHRGSAFDNLDREASFTIVPTRAIQKETKQSFMASVFGSGNDSPSSSTADDTGDTGTGEAGNTGTDDDTSKHE